MTVLVTGGTGFVGSRIVHALRAQALDVRALVRRPERAAHLRALGVELVAGDMSDPASLRANNLGGLPSENNERIGAYAAVGADTVYLQVLDIRDHDQVRLIASEVAPHV